MKTILLGLLTLAMILPVYGQRSKNTKPKLPTETERFKLNSFNDTVNYIIGSDIAYTLKRNGLDISAPALLQGLQDAIEGKDSLFSIEQSEAIIHRFTQQMAETQRSEVQSSEPQQTLDGATFLSENKSNPDVVQTASGLQYIVIQIGEGESPTSTSKITVHYRGSLIDGSVFDSSYDRGVPATFELNRLIRGWVEGIQLMKRGAKFIFFVPPDLGYGEREKPRIPPNSVLVFEVELIDFEN